jgi:hypothetical protein
MAAPKMVLSAASPHGYGAALPAGETGEIVKLRPDG